MLLCFIVVFAVVFFSGIRVNPVVWMFLPIVMLVEYIMGLGIAMISSAVTVYFRDLQHILGIVQMAWMFMTPIVYPISYVPEHLLPIFYMNPMTPIVTAYRDILYYARPPMLSTLVSALCFGIVMLAAGFAVFNRLKRGFAEEL
jgi:ABC-2 type transport system permease protein